MKRYLCYHHVMFGGKFKYMIPNFGQKFKFEMQNANSNGKCNRLSVKPFIATALFILIPVVVAL